MEADAAVPRLQEVHLARTMTESFVTLTALISPVLCDLLLVIVPGVGDGGEREGRGRAWRVDQIALNVLRVAELRATRRLHTPE